MSLYDIQQTIKERVDVWKPRIWAWPHDSFMEQPWGYAIHEGSVKAWNAEGRKTECAKFLLEWATIKNIEQSLQQYGLTDYSYLESAER